MSDIEGISENKSVVVETTRGTNQINFISTGEIKQVERRFGLSPNTHWLAVNANAK